MIKFWGESFGTSLRQNGLSITKFLISFFDSCTFRLLFINLHCTSMHRAPPYSSQQFIQLLYLCGGFFSGMRPYLFTVHIVCLGTHRGNCILFTFFSKLFIPNFNVWMTNHQLWNCVYDHLICLENKPHDDINRGFAKDFDPLVKWTSDFWNPLVHTEIHSSTILINETA